MSKQLIYKKIHIDIYGQIIHVICCEDCYVQRDSILLKKLPQFELETMDFNGWKGITRTRGYEYLVLLNSKHGQLDLISTIVHESFHVSNGIFNYIGIKPDFDNDEAQAYLLSDIFQKILNAVIVKV